MIFAVAQWATLCFLYPRELYDVCCRSVVHVIFVVSQRVV